MNKEELNTYIRHLESMQNEKSAMRYSHAEGKAEGRLEGRAEGLAEGKKIGRADAMREMARTLKSFGKMTIEEIAVATGLSLDEIKNLQ